MIEIDAVIKYTQFDPLSKICQIYGILHQEINPWLQIILGESHFDFSPKPGKL